MKAWRLTNTKEYKLYTTDSSATSATNQGIFFEPTQPEKPFVKVKLAKANLSCTDIECYLGKGKKNFPIIPARSGVALVSEPYDSGLEQGRKVFISPYDLDGKDSFKIRSYDTDGYLGDFMFVPLDSIYIIPEGVSDDQVLFVEDIAMCINTISKLNIERGEYIVMQGASYLNIIMAQIAIYYQAIPIIIDDNEDRLEIAENAGVYYTINTNESKVLSKIIEITSGKLADKIVFDTDLPSKINEQLSLLKKGGKVAFYGYNMTSTNINCDISIVLHKGLNFIGVNNGYNDISSAINMLANNIIKIDGLIESATPFMNIVEIIKASVDEKNYFKKVITFE